MGWRLADDTLQAGRGRGAADDEVSAAAADTSETIRVL